MTAVPNERNGGSNSNGPTLWSTSTHEFTVTLAGATDTETGDFDAIIIGKHALTDAWNDWETYDLADEGEPVATWLSIMQGDALDDHYRPAIAHMASTGRTYVARPVHGEPFQVLVSDPNVIDTWTEAVGAGHFPTYDDSFSGSASYDDSANYIMFLPRPDGGLILLMAQADNDTQIGRDLIGFELEPGETEWAALGGTVNNEIAICNEVDEDPPERVYHAGEVVAPDGTLHCFIYWHWDSGDNTTRYYLTHIKRDPAGVWRDIEDNAVTMPITYDYANANGLILPDQLTRYQQTWQASLDADGNPRIVARDTTGDATGHWYWDGAAWQNETADRRGMRVLINGIEYRYTGIGDYPTLRETDSATVLVRVGGPTGDGNFEPMPDPVRMQAGVFAICVPDGDTPRVYTFGDGARLRLAA